MAAAWHRPWESSRDRSTFALGFSSALVTDVFLDLSRSFLLALRQGLVQNPPAYSSEATIRPGDLYYLHKMMHSAHDAAIKAIICGLGESSESLLRFFCIFNFFLLLLIGVVHMAFLSPYSQLLSAYQLSELILMEGGYCQSETTPTLVRLELLDTIWARQPTHVTETNQSEAEILHHLEDLLNLAYDTAIPRPSYEIATEAAAPWLLVSSEMRSKLGLKIKEIQVSVDDARYFGPYWARTLMSTLGLYDFYVLHAVPLRLFTSPQCRRWSPNTTLVARLRSRGAIPLLPVQERIIASREDNATFAKQCLRDIGWTALFLFRAFLVCVLFSSFLRSLFVLSCRMYVNNQFCLRHLRRYAFIAQEMRRVNRAASTVLLELWVAWGASMLILLWIIVEAGQRSHGAWSFWIIGYGFMEFWSLAHVRSKQSRWIFPRVSLVINAGAFTYVYWWPLAPQWILVSLVLWSDLTLCFYLLIHFDYCFSLPPQPPHQLFVSSLLLPAVTLSRSAGDTQTSGEAAQTSDSEVQSQNPRSGVSIE
eukprot:s1023_g6.t1